MKIIFLFISMALLSFNGIAAEDYMYFAVESISLKSNSRENHVLSGQTVASKIYVMIDNNEFEINGSISKPISAKTYLTDKRLYFLKDEIKFSTTLASTNILYSLESLTAKNAEIELSNKEILIEGSGLEALMKSTSFLIRNISMRCLVDEFTTDVDIACLKDVDIKPFVENYGYLRVQDTDEENYEIEMKTDNLFIKNNELFISAKSLNGRYEQGFFSFTEGSVRCFKNPKLSDLNVQKIINGCLEYSNLGAQSVSFKKSALDVSILGASVASNDGGLEIKAKAGEFNNGDGKTLVENLVFKCGSLDIDINNPNPFAVINGCLNSSLLNIDRFNNGEEVLLLETSEGLINVNDFKKLRLEIDNNEFTLKTRVKFIGRISVRISGVTQLLEKERKLILDIKKATIASISARKVALYILKSFLDNESVSIDGNRITIKL